MVTAPERVVDVLDTDTVKLAGTGWQAYEALNRYVAELQQPQVLYPDARFILPLAMQAIAKGEATDIEQVQPVYLRDKVTWKKLPGRG